MKTYVAKSSEIDRKWYVIDLKGAILGRAAVTMANILRGKHRPFYTPHVDCGDHIVVINARHVALSGKKAADKKYYRYSGYIGGMKVTTFKQMIEKFPERVIEHAVKGMIPHNRLGRQVFKKLHIYADDHHPHQAQKPEALKPY